MLWLEPKAVERLLHNLIALRHLLASQYQDSTLFKAAAQHLLIILLYKDKSAFDKYALQLDRNISEGLEKYANEEYMKATMIGRVASVIYKLIEVDKKFEN